MGQVRLSDRIGFLQRSIPFGGGGVSAARDTAAVPVRPFSLHLIASGTSDKRLEPLSSRQRIFATCRSISLDAF